MVSNKIAKDMTTMEETEVEEIVLEEEEVWWLKTHLSDLWKVWTLCCSILQ